MRSCGTEEFCSMHQAAMKSLGILKERTDSMERRFLRLQKDTMAVIADLQTASAKSTEQLSKYNATLNEILIGIRELVKDKKNGKSEQPKF